MSKIYDEFENQMIIRFPEHIADKINAQFNQQPQKKQQEKQKSQASLDQKSNEPEDQKQIDIDFQLIPFLKKLDDQNTQKLMFKVKVDEFESEADLIDLPCIIETQKTADRINFFKSNDVCQMIKVHDKGKNEPDITEAETYYEIDPTTNMRLKKYKTNDGISTCTKQIRKKFHRQIPKINPDEVNEVEKKMDAIFKEISNQTYTSQKRKYKKKI